MRGDPRTIDDQGACDSEDDDDENDNDNNNNTPFNYLQRWPDQQVPEFRPTVTSFFNKCKHLTFRILDVVALGLKLKVRVHSHFCFACGDILKIQNKHSSQGDMINSHVE